MRINDLLNNKSIKQEENYLVISSLLSMSKPEIIINKDKEISKKEYNKYKKIVKRLEKGESIDYILKIKNFYGYDFYINKNVLIPRPETEILVKETDILIKDKFKNNNISILDIGTGSGIIAITLKLLGNKRKVIATDISKKALKVAIKNSKKYNADIEFIKTDLYKNINKKFDIIISNPPYIDYNSKTIEKKVKDNEPHLALFAKDEGLYFYKEILKNIKSIINKDHIIAFEIGENQGDKIKEIIKEYLPNDKIIIKKDYNNFDRYIFIISK